MKIFKKNIYKDPKDKKLKKQYFKFAGALLLGFLFAIPIQQTRGREDGSPYLSPLNLGTPVANEQHNQPLRSNNLFYYNGKLYFAMDLKQYEYDSEGNVKLEGDEINVVRWGKILCYFYPYHSGNSKFLFDGEKTIQYADNDNYRRFPVIYNDDVYYVQDGNIYKNNLNMDNQVYVYGDENIDALYYSDGNIYFRVIIQEEDVFFEIWSYNLESQQVSEVVKFNYDIFPNEFVVEGGKIIFENNAQRDPFQLYTYDIKSSTLSLFHKSKAVQWRDSKPPSTKFTVYNGWVYFVDVHHGRSSLDFSTHIWKANINTGESISLYDLTDSFYNNIEIIDDKWFFISTGDELYRFDQNGYYYDIIAHAKREPFFY